MTTSINLDHLVQQAQQDTEAFKKIYTHFYQKVYHFFIYRTRDAQESYDLTALTFEKVIKKLPTYQKKKNIPFEAWLFTIARNNLIDQQRKSKKRNHVPLETVAPFLAQDDTTLIEKMEKKRRLEKVTQAIRQLKPKYQQILSLRFFDQLSNQEIAQILEKTPQEVATQVHRGLKQLKKIIPPPSLVQ